MSRMLKIGSHEFHVVVQPLVAGGFTYACVDVDLSGPNVSEIRYDSHLRFETEDEAYEGGSAHARRQAAKMTR